jgi:hypothetical protein
LRAPRDRATMQAMELAIVFTLWLTFGAFLIFPTLNAPPVFARMAIGLCFSEFVVAVAWSVGREDCVDRPCPALVDTLHNAAGYQIPAMTAAMFVCAFAYGVFVKRSW